MVTVASLFGGNAARRCAIGLVCAFCTSAVVYVFVETRHSTATPHASRRTISAQSVEDPTPFVGGSWDLVWKDSTKRRQQVRLCVHQEGTRLIIRSDGNKSIRMKKNGLGTGLVTPVQISFSLTLKGAAAMIFTGKLQNGILCGTTNTGFSWIALRHLN